MVLFISVLWKFKPSYKIGSLLLSLEGSFNNMAAAGSFCYSITTDT